MDKAEQITVNVIKKVENEIRPAYATQGGFVGGAAPTNNYVSPFVNNPQPTAPPPQNNISNPNPTPVAFSQRPVITEENPQTSPLITEPEPQAPATVIHNHYGTLEKSFKRHILEAVTVLVAVIFIGAVFSFFANRSNQANLKAQNETIKQLANSLSINSLSGNFSKDSKLNFNVDTIISNGKKFTATGQVAIQNEADSNQAFTIQNAQGSYLLTADTANGVVTIGDSQPGQQALLVNGDITATGAITSNGAVVSSGGLSADNGSTTLSNSGLTIKNVLVCTAAGCTSSKPIPDDISHIAYTNTGQTFVGDNTFTGETTFKAISTKAFQIQNSTGTDNIFYVDTNNNRIGIGTIPINGGAALQVAGSINVSTGSYQVGGTNGTSVSCASGQLLQQAIIQGGIITSGSCVTIAGASTPTLQQIYDASTPAKIGLSSASGQLQIQDSASPLATNLFSVTNNGATTTYFAVNSLGISVTGNVNTTGQYQINGTQIASTDLGDNTNLAHLNANQTFTGQNTFSSATNSFTGNGSGLISVNASQLNSQAASYYTNATNISAGTLSDGRLSANVALLNAGQTFTGNNSFHLNTTALTVQDASSPLATDLFVVSNNAGTTKYLAVSSTGVKVNGFDVCTTSGNCAGVGGGVTTAGGTTGKLAKFTASNGIGDSIVSDSGTAVTIGGNLAANNITQNGNNVCDASGNCVGVSGGGIGGSGTANKIALFTGTGFTIGNSILTQASLTVTAAGSFNVTGSYELNGVQVDSSILSNDGNLAKLNATQTFTGANTFSNASNSFTGNGSGLSSLNAGNIATGTLSDSRLSTNVALLNGTGPQTFSGNNKFSGTVLTANTGASAFTIQNATGSSTLFVADTTNTRIAIGQTLATYTLDVAGDVNTSTGYRVGGSAGTGITCTSGNVIQNPVVVGGIITGGTCVANGGGVTTTLQDAYNNSLSPALITTSSSTKGILLKAGSTFDSNNLLQVENAAGNNMFNINSNTSSVTIGGATNSTTAFQVQNSGAQNVLDVDTTNGIVNITTISAPSTVTAMQAPVAPSVTPTGTTGSTSYSYEVTAISSNGAETLASTAGTTASGNATLSSTNYNALSWTAVTGASLYKVYRTVGGSTTGLVGSATSTSFNDIGYTGVGSAPSLASSGSLLTSTAYYYKVTALDSSGGETLASAETSITTGSSYNTVTLSWAPVAGARSYRVYRGTSSGGENTYYAAYTNGYTDTASSGTAASPPSASTAYANVLGNNAANTITLNNSGVSAATIYVGSNVPTSPVGTLSGVGTVTNSSLAPLQVVGSYAYSVGGTYPNNYLQIIDVSNPTAPVVVGKGSAIPGINKIIVAGNYAYLITQNGSPALSVVNISNKSNPTQVGSINNTQLGAPINMSIQGNYLYAMTQSGKFEVIDVSNPANPVLASSLSLTTGSSNSYATAVSGSYAYVAGSTSWTVNISNPFAPSLVSSGGPLKVTGSLVSPDGLRISGGYIYEANSASGFLIYSIANPANPVLVGSENSGSIGGQGVYVSGRYAYTSYKGWKIEDISNPQHPFAVASQFTSTAVMNIAAQGRYMYTVDSNTGTFSIYDLGGAYIQNLQTGATEAGSLQVDTDLSVSGNSNIQGGLDVGQGLAVGGNIGASGNLVVSGNLAGSGINSPILPSISTGGTAGTTSYSYQVVAVNAYGTTAPSYTATITTGNAVLSSTNYVSLVWGTVTGATSYNIYRTASGGTPSTTGYVGSSSTTSFNDTGFAASGSAPTADASGLLKIAGGVQIQNSSGTALLSTDSNNMRISIDSTYTALSTVSTPTLTLQNSPAAPTVTATGTTGSSTYAYEVAAVTSQGLVSVLSSAGSTTSGNATLSSANYNAISWSAVTGASTYNIYRTSSNGAPSTTGLIGSTSGTSINDTGLSASGPAPTATGLTNATTYCYEITALDAAGGETRAGGENCKITTATGQGIVLQWNPVAGAVAYRIYRGTTGGAEAGYYTTVGTYSSPNFFFIDNGATQDNTATTPPTVTNAYTSTNNSNNGLQLSVGGNGTPTGQVYVSGTVPSSAAASATLNGSPQNVAVSGRYAYVVSTSPGNIEVVNISNPLAPVQVGSVALSSSSSSAWIAVQGRYAYVTSGSYIQTYDISNPSQPAFVGKTRLASGGTGPITVEGNYAYVETGWFTGFGGGLAIYDLSNPASPVQKGNCPIVAGSTDSQSIAVQGGYVYMTAQNFIYIINATNPVSPYVVSSISLTSIGEVAIQNNILYASRTSTIYSYDISNPANPILKQNFTSGTFGAPRHTVISDRYLYITGGSALNIIDISNPTNMKLVGSNTSARIYAISGRYGYGIDIASSVNFLVYDLGGIYTQGLEAGSAELGNLQVNSNEQIAGDSNIQGNLAVGQSLQIGGNLSLSGGGNLQGGLTLGGGGNQLTAPMAPTVSNVGTTGSTTYTYYITALNAYGGETTASPAGTTTTGNGTLSSTNYNTLTWTAVSGATSYNIYRWSGGVYSLIASSNITSFSDIGYSSSAVTVNPPTTNTTGQLTVQGASLFKNTTDSTVAFQVQNASGTTFFSIDTSGGNIYLGVTGSTSANSTLHIADSTAGIQTITIGSTNSSSGVTIQAGTGRITLTGQVKVAQSGTALSSSNLAESGAGSATLGSGSTDTAGSITTSTTAHTTVTLTFGATMTNAPYCVVTPGDPNAAAIAGSATGMYVTTTATTMVINTASDSTAATWIYHCFTH